MSIPIIELSARLQLLGRRSTALLPAAMRVVAQKVRKDVTDRARTILNDKGFPGFNTGFYARAWKTEVGQRGNEFYVHVFNQAPYAGVIEYGRRAGVRPPSSALIPWVRRKLRVPAKRAAGVAFVVARAIGRRTIAGRHILTDPTFDAKMRKEFVADVLTFITNKMRGTR